MLAASTIRLGQLSLVGEGVVWSEGRPAEQGRNVLVEWRAGGAPRDLIAPPFDARTRAHEYGGGAFTVWPGGIAFCHNADQQVYVIGGGATSGDVDAPGTPRRLTHAADQRYADLLHDAMRQRLIAVREDHAHADAEAVATLVSIDLASGAVDVLAEGRDFFSSPALSPDGSRLAWLTWDHPQMPWDGSTLWCADVYADGRLHGARRVAGGTAESIVQPAWSPAGQLHFISDSSGWWNLCRERADDGAIEALHPMQAEFAQPQWVFGMSSYGFDADGRIVCACGEQGVWRLARLDSQTGAFEPIATPFCAIESLRVGAGHAVFIGAAPGAPPAVVRLDLRSGRHEVLRGSSSVEVDSAFLSRAEPIAFPTEGGLDAHAFYYPPTHADRCGPTGARPPLIVVSHGGPTSASDAGFKWGFQFWTSRGFAVVDVNYGGSTGYGRAYRERLDGRWGIVDVDDCIAAARFLVARGDVDGGRVAIRGGSAGGYTTLCALTFRDYFKAGASHYGIGDLESLATDTHKFESRYLERLIGPYPAAREMYRARSPVHHTGRLSSPMILFQGAEDKAVPPAQAAAMAAAVDAKGLPVAYLLFEGEQHGFRRAATIRRVFEAELYFYGRVFGFEPADAIEPVEIRNLTG